VVYLGRNPETDKRRQHWETVHGTRKDAQRRLTEFLHRLDAENLVAPSALTLGAFLEHWFVEYVEPSLSPRTAEVYISKLRCHVIPHLGNLLLRNLKPEDLQRLYATLIKTGRCRDGCPLSNRTVHHIHVILSNALDHALKWELITRNPAKAVRPPKVERREMRAWNGDQVVCFLEKTRSNIDYVMYFELFYIDFATGMRLSEILALRWNDVDLDTGEIRINRTVYQLNDGSIVYGSPKSVRSRRTIVLPPSAIEVLRRHYQAQTAYRTMLGLTLNEDDFIFTRPDGRPFRPGTIGQAFRRMVKHTDLPPIRFHDIRHTHASLLIQQRVNPKVIQERLGHASIQTTFDTYGHLYPGTQQAAADIFDREVLEGALPKQLEQ
jgi:integrase